VADIAGGTIGALSTGALLAGADTAAAFLSEAAAPLVASGAFGYEVGTFLDHHLHISDALVSEFGADPVKDAGMHEIKKGSAEDKQRIAADNSFFNQS
jgi:hypothetical protein